MSVVAMAGLWLASASAGTIVVPQSVDELTRGADVIVRGSVVRQDASWSPDHHLIHTLVRIRVEEAMKGAPETEIVIRRPGGVVGDIGQRAQGAPEFADGERVVLFLSKLPAATPLYQVQGLAQGKFSLRDVNGVTQATQDTRDLSFARGGRLEPGELVTLPLADLAGRIKRAIGVR